MAKAKDPIMSAILSFVIPGLGQVYCGKIKKGIAFFIGTVIGSMLLFIPGLIIWAVNVYDAYMEAKGKPVWKFD